jgi:hypothetical protein
LIASSSAAKKARGPTRGLGLEKIMKASKGKMQIDIPADKGRPVDAVQSAKLSNELGIVARHLLPVPQKGTELSQEDKDVAFERIAGRYSFDDEDHVRPNIESLLMQRSRDERSRLHKIYQTYKSDEEARQCPPKNTSMQNWLHLCDLFADSGYQLKQNDVACILPKPFFSASLFDDALGTEDEDPYLYLLLLIHGDSSRYLNTAFY